MVCDGPALRLLIYPVLGAGGLGDVALDTTATSIVCSPSSLVDSSASTEADLPDDASRSLYNSSLFVLLDTHRAVASLAVIYDKANPAVLTPPTVDPAPLLSVLASLRRGCKRLV